MTISPITHTNQHLVVKKINDTKRFTVKENITNNKTLQLAHSTFNQDDHEKIQLRKETLTEYTKAVKALTNDYNQFYKKKKSLKMKYLGFGALGLLGGPLVIITALASYHLYTYAKEDIENTYLDNELSDSLIQQYQEKHSQSQHVYCKLKGLGEINGIIHLNTIKSQFSTHLTPFLKNTPENNPIHKIITSISQQIQADDSVNMTPTEKAYLLWILYLDLYNSVHTAA